MSRNTFNFRNKKKSREVRFGQLGKNSYLTFGTLVNLQSLSRSQTLLKVPNDLQAPDQILDFLNLGRHDRLRSMVFLVDDHLQFINDHFWIE